MQISRVRVWDGEGVGQLDVVFWSGRVKMAVVFAGAAFLLLPRRELDCRMTP